MKTLTSLLTIAILAGGGWYLYAEVSKPKSLFANPTEYRGGLVSQVKATSGLAATIAAADEPQPGSIKYVNSKYGFSYYHSPQSKLKEYDEGGGATTIVHENLQKQRGLQIFVVPYSEKLITDERFKKDVPSGIRYNIENTDLGEIDVPAVTFNSYDDFLGETRELWFIYDGHLYEITTFKGFGEWFGPLMKSWRFLCKNDLKVEISDGCPK